MARPKGQYRAEAGGGRLAIPLAEIFAGFSSETEEPPEKMLTQLIDEAFEISEAKRLKLDPQYGYDPRFAGRYIALRWTLKGLTPPPIVSDHRYFQALRAGFDPASARLAVDDRGRPCQPVDGVVWVWWTSRKMPWTARVALVMWSVKRREYLRRRNARTYTKLK